MAAPGVLVLTLAAGRPPQHSTEMTCVRGHVFISGVLTLGPVSLGRRVRVGPSSVVMPLSTVGEGVHVGALSCIGVGEVLEDGSSWRGSPLTATEASASHLVVNFGTGVKAHWMFLIGILCVGYLNGLATLPPAALYTTMDMSPAVTLFVVFAAFQYLGSIVTIIVGVCVKQLLVQTLSQGPHQDESICIPAPSDAQRLRWWVVNTTLHAMQPALGMFSGTAALRWFLRRLGATVSPDAFISGLRLDFAADSVSLGEACWFGANVMPFPVTQREDGGVEIRPIAVHAGCLVSDNVLLNDCVLGEGTTVGSLSVIESRVTAKNSRWVGSPAVEIRAGPSLRSSELLDGFKDTEIDRNSGRAQVGARAGNGPLFEIGLWAGIIVES